jgi:hypothetical protein
VTGDTYSNTVPDSHSQSELEWDAMKNIKEAKQCLITAWPKIVKECRLVLGSELHYQAMVYHCLRSYGKVPIDQIGMNVKMYIESPESKFFRELEKARHVDFQGVEPIPDVCLFKTDVGGDWRRRSRENTLNALLLAIEVKASERKDKRLTASEIVFDIKKLSAHRDEARHRKSTFLPVMMVIDTAPKESERMSKEGLSESLDAAQKNHVEFLYLSPEAATSTLKDI